ncbi:MAG: IS200/IS605 family transposase, partial [Longimicrobiales bacterium]
GKVARDHVHVFLSYRPTQKVSQIVQWLKGTTSRVLLQEFPRLRKQLWAWHLWARGCLVPTESQFKGRLTECPSVASAAHQLASR